MLRIERTFDAPVEEVFDAWTSEEVLRRWFHGMADWETPTAEVDLRVGGTIRIVMRDPSGGTEAGATGEYRVVDPPRRLVFTWVWDDQPDQPQLIELEFSERDGRHDGVDDEQRDPHGRAPRVSGTRLARVLRQPRASFAEPDQAISAARMRAGQFLPQRQPRWRAVSRQATAT